MSVAHSWQMSRTAQFTASTGPFGAVITVSGELDAANANKLADYVERYIEPPTSLTLDLRGLEFIGTAGFSTLHRIEVACSKAGSQWTMVPGRVVSRMLRICDPDGALPVTTLALHTAQEEPDPSLQLIPQSR